MSSLLYLPRKPENVELRPFERLTRGDEAFPISLVHQDLWPARLLPIILQYTSTISAVISLKKLLALNVVVA
jgi:hypothetical protein